VTGGIFMLTSSTDAGVESTYQFGILGGTLVGTKFETSSVLEKKFKKTDFIV
jgi:hypothetical protein